MSMSSLIIAIWVFCISVSLSVAVAFTFSGQNWIQSQKNEIKMCPGCACFSVFIQISGYTSCEHQNKLVYSTRRDCGLAVFKRKCSWTFRAREKASFSCSKLFYFLSLIANSSGM